MRKEELMELNLYRILEVPFNASDDQITGAFKKLVRKLHPDKQTGEKTSDEFILVKSSRDALLDKKFKKSYNAYWRPKIDEIENDKNEFLNKIACLKFRNRELQNTINVLRSENSQISSKNNSLAADVNELDHLRRHNVEISRKMKEMENELQNLRELTQLRRNQSFTEIEEIENENELWKINKDFIIRMELPHLSKKSFRLHDATIVGSPKCNFENFWLQIQLEDKNDGMLNIYLVVKESKAIENIKIRWRWSILMPSLAEDRPHKKMSKIFSRANRCCILASMKKEKIGDSAHLVIKLEEIDYEVTSKPQVESF